MAEEKEKDKVKYPTMPVGSWWALRKKFKQSIPGVVTDSYLAAVLNMQPLSARTNILPSLKQLGIIDDDGKTGERARLWRDDESYPDVCKEMLSEVYPQELLHAVPDPMQDRDQAERWFANKTGAGENAAGKMTGMYAILAEADASKQPDQEKKERTSRKPREPRELIPAMPRVPPSVDPPQHLREPAHEKPPVLVPGININLQVHISADATTDQIDQIFASMAKHIYQRD